MIALAPANNRSGFAEVIVSITPESSGRGSRTNRGSDSSVDAPPAMMWPEGFDSSMWPRDG